MKHWNTFIKAILGGICISLGGIVNLKVGGVAGACLFAFGLITVLFYGLELYTGLAGRVTWKEASNRLILTIMGNVIGCLSIAFAIKSSMPDLVEKATIIMNSHLEYNYFELIFLSACCGFIMEVAVGAYKSNMPDPYIANPVYHTLRQILPTLFGIPLFILCGFIHSIADAFYIGLASDFHNLIYYLTYYITILSGNFIGCNVIRFCNWISK